MRMTDENSLYTVTKSSHSGGVDISVFLQVYNHAGYIRKALDSVFKQTVSSKSELIIFDDCSDDGTSDLILESIHDKNNVTYVRANVNLLSRGFRPLAICLKYFNGNFCAFIDGDDVWIADDKNEIQLKELSHNDDSALVICGYIENDINGNRIDAWVGSQRRTVYYKPADKILTNEFYTIQTSSMMCRSSILKLIMNDVRRIPPGGDMKIQVECSLRNNVVSYGFYGVQRNRSKGVNVYEADKKRSITFKRKNFDYKMRVIKEVEGWSGNGCYVGFVKRYYLLYFTSALFYHETAYPENIITTSNCSIKDRLFVLVVRALARRVISINNVIFR